jgi:hypothetical protein
LFVIDLSKLKKYDAAFYTMTHLSFNDVNDILLGTGKRKFGFHPVSILRILLSINGIVAVDDYSKSDQEYATKQTVDKFCESHNLKLNLKPFTHILKEI